MIGFIITLAAVLFLFGLYLLSLRGSGRPDAMAPFAKWDYAHRGLHGHGVPENSLTAFRNAKERGFGAELDVHLTVDGRLAVVHDNSLLRTAGIDRRVCEMTAEELAAVRLENTDERLPMLEEVLAVFDGSAPLIIELKAERRNHAALCQAVCDMLDGYAGEACIESFDPRCLLWLKTHRPDIVRGQLAQNFFQSKEVAWPLRLVLTALCCNALTRPDFIAYRFEHRRDIPLRLCKTLWKTPLVYWTLHSNEDVSAAKHSGAVAIFEE